MYEIINNDKQEALDHIAHLRISRWRLHVTSLSKTNIEMGIKCRRCGI